VSTAKEPEGKVMDGLIQVKPDNSYFFFLGLFALATRHFLVFEGEVFMRSGGQPHKHHTSTTLRKSLILSCLASGAAAFAPSPVSLRPAAFEKAPALVPSRGSHNVAINVRGAVTSVNEVAEEAGKDNVSEDEAAKKAAATKADEVCLRVRSAHSASCEE
jgi:hypothetical protein